MVSFSCENCGDVLTKKKLDAHRTQCRGASFTCLDCMRHFQSTDYRAHTSCISEAEKYQGHLYRPEKEKKAKAKPVTADTPSRPSSTQPPRKAYVEDAPDADTGTVSIIEAPPPAPSPPPGAPPAKEALPPVNVFDFLVNDDTPNASMVDLGPSPLSVNMVQDTPAVFEASRQLQGMTGGNASKETFGESRYGETGFHYGAGPVPVLPDEDHILVTPAPGRAREASKRDHKKDKKRKRNNVEELDLSLARQPTADGDEIMTDAPPVLHSGLTGGLNRLLSRPSEFPPSPEYSTGDGAEPSPSSPIKRTKQMRDGGVTAVASTNNGITALVPTKRTSSTVRTADGTRLHGGKHRHHHHHGSSHHHGHGHRKRRHHHSDEDESSQQSHRHASSKRKRNRAIEYSGGGAAETSQQQMVVYRTRAEHFSSFVNKGPDSEKGCSLNKVLKRYHRERDEVGVGLGRQEEEKELWKSLRLRKNERGEIVLFA